MICGISKLLTINCSIWMTKNSNGTLNIMFINTLNLVRAPHVWILRARHVWLLKNQVLFDQHSSRRFLKKSGFDTFVIFSFFCDSSSQNHNRAKTFANEISQIPYGKRRSTKTKKSKLYFYIAETKSLARSIPPPSLLQPGAFLRSSAEIHYR